MMTIQRPRTDRQRGGNAFLERWTNAKAAFVGFLLGRGYSTFAIADILDDRTDPPTIGRMSRLWGLPSWGRSSDVFLVVAVKQRERAALQARADQHGISLEEYCRRIVVCASMPRDRYSEIVGKDQFE